jgi:glycerol-1-phosphate dehydrogenase [NAD(P)+]
VPTRRALVGAGVLDDLPALLAELRLNGPALLVADANTWEVAGRRVGQLLRSGGLSFRDMLLSPQGAHGLEATEEAAAEVGARMQDEFALAVAVGSGTINDLTRLPASNAGIPYVAVATAASMNGYTSAIAAIVEGGIKRTVPCTPPVAVVADTDILAAAPREMTAAGFGDLLSKATSSADWKMASLVRGEYYCDRPVQVVEEAERRCRANAAAIGRGDQGAIEGLIIALLQSGISMAMAGSSAPASGGEHLISHYWDMTASARGRERRLHGEQVAVASLVCASLYEALRALPLSEADIQRALQRRPGAAEVLAASRAHFAPLLGDEIAEGIARELAAKHLDRDGVEPSLARIVESPSAFWAELVPILRSGAELRDALAAAGTPTTIAQLGISPPELRDAFIHAREIRGRYTILDLAFDLGALGDLRDEVTQASGVLT